MRSVAPLARRHFCTTSPYIMKGQTAQQTAHLCWRKSVQTGLKKVYVQGLGQADCLHSQGKTSPESMNNGWCGCRGQDAAKQHAWNMNSTRTYIHKIPVRHCLFRQYWFGCDRAEQGIAEQGRAEQCRPMKGKRSSCVQRSVCALHALTAMKHSGVNTTVPAIAHSQLARANFGALSHKVKSVQWGKTEMVIRLWQLPHSCGMACIIRRPDRYRGSAYLSTRCGPGRGRPGRCRATSSPRRRSGQSCGGGPGAPGTALPL